MNYDKIIEKHNLLTPEEEIELSKKVLANNGSTRQAVDKLTLSNLRLVRSIVEKYKGFCKEREGGLSTGDLMNEGVYGLIIAASRYDYTKNVKFGSYASWWINQKIRRAILTQSSTVRIPDYKQLESNRNKKKISQMQQKDEIINLDSLEVEEVFISRSTSDGEDIVDLIPDSKTEFDNGVIDKIFIEEVLSTVSDRERKIVSMYFGLNDKPNYNLEDVASEFNISRETVRKTIVKVMACFKSIIE